MKSYKQIVEEYIYLLEQTNKNLVEQVDHLKNRGAERNTVVYILQQENTSNYKIGFSTNYADRKSKFDVKLPFNMIEIAVYPTDFYREAEQALHSFFKEKRLNGSEFFDLTAEDLEKIPEIIDKAEATPEDYIKEKTSSDDILLEEARKITKEMSVISASFLQRKLKVGYARAARIKDTLVNEREI